MKDRILQLMKHQGMTQKEFAGELCVAEATLSSIYTGRTRPTNNMVNAIHERFPEVNISWLMFGEGEMFVEQHAESEASPTGALDDGTLASRVSVGGSNAAATLAPLGAQCIQEIVKYVDKPVRKITEIRVFYDDGTFETFMA